MFLLFIFIYLIIYYCVHCVKIRFCLFDFCFYFSFTNLSAFGTTSAAVFFLSSADRKLKWNQNLNTHVRQNTEICAQPHAHTRTNIQTKSFCTQSTQSVCICILWKRIHTRTSYTHTLTLTLHNGKIISPREKNSSNNNKV